MNKSIILLTFVLAINVSWSQNNLIHNKDTNKEIIDSVLSCFNKHYVSQDVATSIDSSIREKYNKGEYTQFENVDALINQLWDDLLKITNDRHIGIRYIEKPNIDSKESHSLFLENKKIKSRNNFNIKAVECLPGNVGYLRIDGFEDPVYAGEKLTSAINFIDDCEAVILDLRYNGGGEEKMVRFLSSYFLTDPTLLNTRFFPRNDSMVQSWTNSYVPGKKLINKKVYILVSNYTSSAAEAFTSIMKNYNRATIVGEKTKGAAHWVEYFFYPSQKIEVKMPVAYPINPVTKTNWEKIGVTPHFKIPEYEALKKAYELALEKLQEECQDSLIISELEWYKMMSMKRSETILNENFEDYNGQYEYIEIRIKDNHLFWVQGEMDKFVLLPISKDHFVFSDSDDHIVRFIRNKKNIVIAYQLLMKGNMANPYHYKSGKTD